MLETLEPERLQIPVRGRTWTMERRVDMEALWDQMDDANFGDDERLPYWAEIWPASIMLAQWIEDHADLVQGSKCLDVGCGLGLTALVASAKGARVTAFDYEYDAVVQARENGIVNKVPQPLWLHMDWRQPSLIDSSFDFIWGGDVMYEKRFFGPLEKMFRQVLAPGGLIWLAEPRRDVSLSVWEELAGMGWKVEKIRQGEVALRGQKPLVRLWQLSL